MSTYLICEAGSNHNGDLNTAIKLCEEAAKAGANSVKFQLFDKHALYGENPPKDLHEFEWAWWPTLAKTCNRLGIDMSASPFDEQAVEFLDQMNVPWIKVASRSLTDSPLLKAVNNCKRKVYLSCGSLTSKDGMASQGDVGGVVMDELKDCVVETLHCVARYPAQPEQFHLNDFHVLYNGISDHTTGIGVSIAAVALGATVVERHLSLDKTQKGPDHAFALEPSEFKLMVEAIREVEQAL